MRKLLTVLFVIVLPVLLVWILLGVATNFVSKVLHLEEIVDYSDYDYSGKKGWRRENHE